MAPYVNFATLLASRKNELDDLPKDEYLRFGNHIYVLRDEINITQLLEELAGCGTEGGTSPVQHLHVYCHRLSGSLTGDGELELRVHDRGCALKTLHIFCAVVLPFKRLVLAGDESQAAVELSLYYDVNSGPESYWISGRSPSSAAVHAIRGESACLDREAPACAGLQHFDLTATDSAGIRWQGADPLQTIPSVYWDELRAPRPDEFEAFGEHIRRIQNLPRLLDSLFVSAGKDLMGLKPDILNVMAKLRFIIRIAREVPHFVGLVSQSLTLLSRLELPKGVLALTGDKPFDDCFYVPDMVPQALESALDAEMTVTLEVSRKIESGDEMKSLRDLIRKQGGELMKSIGSSISSSTTKESLEQKAQNAGHTTETVINKMDDMREEQRKLEKAKKRFDDGLDAYKDAQEKKLVWDIVKSVGEVGVSVGIAIYTGGAGAPLTVGAVNKLLKGTAEAIEEKSRLMVAITALGKALIAVYPKVNAALQNHKRFSDVSTDPKERGTQLVDKLKETAGTISDKLLAGKAGERVDYLGLWADWRELDVCVDSAFAAIKETIKNGELDGLDEYRLAMKTMAIRGETLVSALKESYEARTDYLVSVAEARAKEAALEEVNSLHQRVLEDGSREAMALMPIKHRLMAQLSHRKRELFNMLHQCVLALMYESNDVKLQKNKFGDLSPDQTSDRFSDQWLLFKNAQINKGTTQDNDLTVSAAEAFPEGWQDLLKKNLQVPFQIPPTLKALRYLYRMRILEIYAEFVGLTRNDGTTDGIERLDYSIWMGPLMVDRASPHKNATSTQGTVVQYYREAQPLTKAGKKNNFRDPKHEFASRTVCCSGKVEFRDVIVEDGWNLGAITDIKLHVKYETCVFHS